MVRSKSISISVTERLVSRPIMMSLWFFTPLKMCTEMIKRFKNQLKINRLDYTVNLSKSYKIKNYPKSYKIKKMLQEADDDGEDSAIGTDVKSDDGGDFQDTIC